MGRRRTSPMLVGLGPIVHKKRMLYYVYLLYSKTRQQVYKGSTSNLKRRFDEHNKGQVVSTRKGVPWRLEYYEAFSNKTDALREEIFLKSGKGKERLKY